MNQKFPEAPEKKQVKKPPNAGDRSTTGEGSARTGDIPTAPQLRRRAESLAEEERRAGIATVLFSLTVAAAALFVCLLVGVLTVRSALPSRGNSKPGVTTDGNGSGNSVTPTDPGAVLFTPGAAVLPSGAGTAKSISDISSSYAVLVDASTGQILAGKNAETEFDPASLTKVMTLLVACQRLTAADLTQDLTYTEEIDRYLSLHYPGVGKKWDAVGDGGDLKDILYGIGVASAADCTIMLVSYVCKASTVEESEKAFVDLMNAEAAKMGLKNTRFDNSIGDSGENNKSTASDMAAIMMRALGSPLIRDILTQDKYVFQAFGYKPDGTFLPSYRMTFYGTLMGGTGGSRLDAYRNQFGKNVTYKLNTLSFQGGKTGSLKNSANKWVYSLASFATDPSGKIYIVVTGETQLNYGVLSDAKTIYDGYIN